MSFKSLKLITIFVLLLFFSLYLAFLNPYSVTFSLSKTLAFNLPVTILALLSFLLGVFALIVINMLLSSRDLFSNMRESYDRYKRKNVAELYQRAEALIFRGKPSQGYALLNKVIKKDPKHVRALQKLGDMYREKGMTEKAITLHSKAAYYNNKEDIETLYSLASDHEKSNNVLEAESILREISKIDNDSIKPLVHLRSIYKKRKEWDRLCSVQKEILRLTKALHSNREDEEKKRLARYCLDHAKSKKDGGDLKEAVKLARLAMKVDDRLVQPYLFVGDIYKKDGNTISCEKALKDGIKRTGSLVFLKELETLYLEGDAKNKIVAMYKKAITEDKKNPILKTMLADAYLRLDMIDESMNEVKEAEEINPDIPLLHKIKAALFEKREDMTGAASEYKTLLEHQSFYTLMFPCRQCGQSLKEWHIICPECEKDKGVACI